jgi:hypothetical protein
MFVDSQVKGQSAIEYLTTYGWMLLVIAIVGGAIFTTVQNSSNIQQTTGFTGEDVQIANFGLNSDDNLSMEIRAASTDQVTLNSIELTGPYENQTEGTQTQTTYSVDDDNNPITAGNTEEYIFGYVQQADTSNQFDVVVTYNTGELSDVTVEGTLTANLYLNETIS